MYKVVVNIDGELKSIQKTMRLTYKLNEEAFPFEETGGLFVFKDKKNAIKYSKEFYQPQAEVYLCEAKNPRKVNTVGYISVQYMVRYWNNNDQYFKHEAPEGTFVCDSLTLLKKVTK